MHVDEKDNQLYISVLLGMLRDYQRKQMLPEFEDFLTEIKNNPNFVSGQSGPLQQRINLLKQLVLESEDNADLVAELRAQGTLEDMQRGPKSFLLGGTLVVADLTDPMLSPRDADGIFQVLLQQFRQVDVKGGCGKVVVCDEAHKYFDSRGSYGLAAAVVETVRLMRHEGMRVVVSTQSPTTMPPELLELSTVSVLHRFHSRDWWKYLSLKIPLPENGFRHIRAMHPGMALVFAQGTDMRRALVDTGVAESAESAASEAFVCCVRDRITKDRGRSRLNESGGGDGGKAAVTTA